MGEQPRRRRTGEDRISGLPDELLHVILHGLGSASAAARTSVLSRRWRHLWRHLPVLVLDDSPDSSPPPAYFLDSVDGALAGYSAPTLESLCISLSREDHYDLPQRVAPWLRFAAERVDGYLVLFMPQRTMPPPPDGDPEAATDGEEKAAALELAACERAKTIVLDLAGSYRLRLQPAAGLFAALTRLTITRGRMEGSELTALVCTRCPRLRYLTLDFLELVATSDVVSLRSGSLHKLVLSTWNALQIEVVAPILEELDVSVSHATQAHICAPNLAVIDWGGDAYDPLRHRFTNVGRCLRVLRIGNGSVVASLIRQFDEVDKLDIKICIPEGTTGFESFLNETSKLPKSTTFWVSLTLNHHGLTPAMLHLLRISCNNTRKLSIRLADSMHSCPLSCPCRLEESPKIDGIALNSLEKVEICCFTYSCEKLELVEFLFCNAAILKKLAIYYWNTAGKLLISAGHRGT